MTRRTPRALGPALETLLARIAPATTLAAVQAVWRSAVGEAVADHGAPIGERDGVLTVACEEAVWANEIELMAPELVVAINAAIGQDLLTVLTCRAGSAAGFSRGRRRKRN